MRDEIVLREATVQDAEAITALHVASWRANYRGVLPNTYLDEGAEAERASHWRKSLNTLSAKDVVLAAEDDADLQGFISVYWRREAGYDAYLDNLHVRPGRNGSGLGRRLLAAAVERMIDHGASNLCLWAFDQNQRAISFYERLGGKAVERGIDDFANANAPHTRIAWSDLPALLAACRKAAL